MIVRGESPAAIAAAVAGYQRYLAGAPEDAFRQQVRWAAAGGRVLVAARQRPACVSPSGNLREDDIARGTGASVNVDGKDIAVFKAPDAETIDRWVKNPGWFGEHRSTGRTDARI